MKILIVLSFIFISFSCTPSQRTKASDSDDGSTASNCEGCETADPLENLQLGLSFDEGEGDISVEIGEILRIHLVSDLPPGDVEGSLYLLPDSTDTCTLVGTESETPISIFPLVEGDSYINIETQNLYPGDFYACVKLSLGSFFKFQFIANKITLRSNLSLSKGYVSRPCGFDLNDDGNVGFAADCKICDGTTTDPDGDGVDEDLWYVDAAGTDGGLCGTPATPCKTIQYAIDNLDGPSVGAEDIICIAGTFNESLYISQSGKTESKIRNEFQYPSNPLMIVGWDKDGDGEYPPYDTDDIALFDSGNSKNEVMNGGSASYIEIAHVSVANYKGVGSTWLYFFPQASPARSHVYFHDIELRNMNEGNTDGGGVVFVANEPTNEVSYIAIENLDAEEIGAPLLHAVSGTSSGRVHDVRINNVSFVGHGQTNSVNHVFIHIDSLHDVEIYSSTFDTNYDSWTPRRAIVLNLGNCAKRVTFRDNHVTEVAQIVNAYLDGSCSSTTLDDLSILRNFATLKNHTLFTSGITLGWRSGTAPNNTTHAFEGVEIMGNYFVKSSPSDINYFLYSEIGNDLAANPGAVKVVGNTAVGLGMMLVDSSSYPLQNYIVSHNVITGASGYAYHFSYAPSSFSGEFNAIGPSMSLRWNNTDQANLAAFQTASSSELNSSSCDPAFVNSGLMNYHLASTDTCAKGKGGDLTSFFTADMDGSPTVSASSNIGADQ